MRVWRLINAARHASNQRCEQGKTHCHKLSIQCGTGSSMGRQTRGCTLICTKCWWVKCRQWQLKLEIRMDTLYYDILCWKLLANRDTFYNFPSGENQRGQPPSNITFFFPQFLFCAGGFGKVSLLRVMPLQTRQCPVANLHFYWLGTERAVVQHTLASHAACVQVLQQNHVRKCEH